jgi:hypothetical protein
MKELFVSRRAELQILLFVPTYLSSISCRDYDQLVSTSCRRHRFDPGKLRILPRIMRMNPKRLGEQGRVRFRPDGANQVYW